MAIYFRVLCNSVKRMCRILTIVFVMKSRHPTEWIHCNDVTMGMISSQITSLTIVYSTVIQAPINENIKAPRHWPLCGEFPGTGEFPAQRASNVENVSIWWRHHDCDWNNVAGYQYYRPTRVVMAVRMISPSALRSGYYIETETKWPPYSR